MGTQITRNASHFKLLPPEIDLSIPQTHTEGERGKENNLNSSSRSRIYQTIIKILDIPSDAAGIQNQTTTRHELFIYLYSQ